MKPFDLQKALAGEPVVTRAGEKVEKIVYNPDALEFNRVIFWVNGICWPCSDSGALGSGQHGHDLFMAPKEVEVWVNVYALSGNAEKTDAYPAFTGGTLYKSQEEAFESRGISPIYICTSPIKITL